MRHFTVYKVIACLGERSTNWGSLFERLAMEQLAGTKPHWLQFPCTSAHAVCSFPYFGSIEQHRTTLLGDSDRRHGRCSTQTSVRIVNVGQRLDIFHMTTLWIAGLDLGLLLIMLFVCRGAIAEAQLPSALLVNV